MDIITDPNHPLSNTLLKKCIKERKVHTLDKKTNTDLFFKKMKEEKDLTQTYPVVLKNTFEINTKEDIYKNIIHVPENIKPFVKRSTFLELKYFLRPFLDIFPRKFSEGALIEIKYSYITEIDNVEIIFYKKFDYIQRIKDILCYFSEKHLLHSFNVCKNGFYLFLKDLIIRFNLNSKFDSIKDVIHNSYSLFFERTKNKFYMSSVGRWCHSNLSIPLLNKPYNNIYKENFYFNNGGLNLIPIDFYRNGEVFFNILNMIFPSKQIHISLEKLLFGDVYTAIINNKKNFSFVNKTKTIMSRIILLNLKECIDKINWNLENVIEENFNSEKMYKKFHYKINIDKTEIEVPRVGVLPDHINDLFEIPRPDNNLQDSQNTHASSVQSSVRNSIEILVKDENKIIVDKINSNSYLKDDIKTFLIKNIDNTEIFCDIRIRDIIRIIFNIVIDEKNKEDISNRINKEFEEEKEVCITGIVSRLINSISGGVYKDDIKVNISEKEQLQIFISSLKENKDKKDKIREYMIEKGFEKDVIKEWTRDELFE